MRCSFRRLLFAESPCPGRVGAWAIGWGSLAGRGVRRFEWRRDGRAGSRDGRRWLALESREAPENSGHDTVQLSSGVETAATDGRMGDWWARG